VVKFTPVELGGGKRTYELKAELTLGKVLSAVAQTLSVPDGILHVCAPTFSLIRRIKAAAWDRVADLSMGPRWGRPPDGI
jgi:hypothetical protein